MKKKNSILLLALFLSLCMHNIARSQVGLSWQEMGPFDMSGPDKHQVLFAPSATYPYRAYAATKRGIFISLNYRIGNWTVCGGSDKLANGVFAGIAQDKTQPDKLYACSGFFSEGIGGYTKSSGVYVSTNAGSTWTLISSTSASFDGVSRVAIDNNDNLFIASIATSTANAALGGIFEVNTASNVVIRVLQFPDPVNPNPSGLDVEVNATSGDIWASSSHISPANTNPACGAGKIYVSKYAANGLNTGFTGNWTDLTPTLSNINWGTTTPPTSFCIYWIYNAVTAADPNRIYLRAATSASSPNHSIFRSDNGGTTWNYCGQAPDNAGDFFSSRIVADQVNEDVVYSGGLSQWKSTDKGQTWTNITPNTTFNLTPASTITGQLEARDYVVNLNAPGEALLTSDGGVFYTSNNTVGNMAPTFTQVNGGLNINSYAFVDLNPTAATNQWVGAASDNGIHFVTSAGTLLQGINAENGITCHYDKTSSAIQVYTLQNDNNFYFKNGTTISHVAATQAMGTGNNSNDWDTRAQLLYASGNAGYFGVVNFTTLAVSYYALTGITNASSYTVSCVKVDPNTAGTVWLGLYSSSLAAKLVKVTGANGGSPVFTDMSSTSFSVGANPASISFYANGAAWDITNMAVCFTNVSSSRIWISASSGSSSSWVNEDGTLSTTLTINDVLKVKVPTSKSSTGYFFYAATSKGLWFASSLAGGTTSWTTEDEMPNAPVRNICYRISDAALAIGSTASGVWMTKDLVASPAQADFQLNKSTLAIGEPLIITNTSWGATSWSWKSNTTVFSTAQNPANQTFSAAGTYNIQLTINGSISVTKTVTVTSTPYFTGLTLNWVEQGPFDLATRSLDIIYAPNSSNPYRAFVATIRGIYRSTDYRYGNWLLSTPSALTPLNAFADIAVDKNNPDKLYACTGSFDDGKLPSGGIYVTTDGGNTWALMPGTKGAFDGVCRMVIDKNNNLFVAATSMQSTKLGGLFMINTSTNVVTQVISTTSSPAFPLPAGLDVEVNATSGDIWATSSPASTLGSSPAAGKLFVSRYSTNGANTGAAGTWVDVTPNLSKITWPGTTAPSSLNIAWVFCAVSAANTNRVYIKIAGPGLQRYDDGSTNGIEQYAILRSDDGGSAWTFKHYDLAVSGNYPHARCLYVDQTNADIVYTGLVYEYKSIDGGANFNYINSVNNPFGYFKATNLNGHVDPRVFLPNLNSSYPNESIAATDGGLFYTTNNTPTGFSATYRQINSGLNNNLFYNIDINPQAGKYDWIAGAQDNGINFGGSTGTYMDLLCDGGSVHYGTYNGTLTTIYTYKNCQNDFYMRTPGSSISTHIIIGSFDPGCAMPEHAATDWDSRAGLLYVQGDSAGRYFIGNFALTTQLPQIAIGITNGNTYNATAIKVDPTLNNVVWLGLTSTTGGAPKLVKVTNANTTPTFTDLSSSSFPSGATFASISFTPGTTGNIAVCFSTRNVARTWVSNNITSGSPTWANIDGNLPSGYNINDVLRISSTKSASGYIVLAATSSGVWYTTYLNGSSTFWQADSKLPVSYVYQLCYRSSDATLAAGTYGQGIWMTGDAGSATNAPVFTVSNTTLCLNDPLYVYNTSLGAGNTYLWNYGDGTTSTSAAPPGHTYTAAGTYTVTLTINGTTSITKTVTVSSCTTVYNLKSPVKDVSAATTNNLGKWLVYPNPSPGGRFNLTAPKNYENVTLKVYDITGRTLLQKKYSQLSTKTSVELGNDKANGMCIVEVSQAGHILYSTKILVMKLDEDEGDSTDKD